MRTNLAHIREVCHYWANKVQSEGRAGNVFFEGDNLYSYGKHFVIARHLPDGVVAFTTQGHSSSTARQVSYAKHAASHLQKVFCHDPDADVFANMRHAQDEIVRALNEAEKPRLRQPTRDAHKARALHIAEQTNAYLAALPQSEREHAVPFDTSKLEHIRVAMNEHKATAARLAEDAKKARVLSAQDDLAAWRGFAWRSGTYDLGVLPVALRLHTAPAFNNLGHVDGKQTIQTSHGAEIPVSFATRLWRLVKATLQAGQDVNGLSVACGVYTLTSVRADGSIVVGCHDIAFSELQAVAQQLGLTDEVTA